MSTKFILLINVKMPKIVGILRFISMINKTSESLKVVVVFVFNVPPTAKVIWRQSHNLKSHLTDW